MVYRKYTRGFETTSVSGLSDEALSGFPVNHHLSGLYSHFTLHEHTNLVCGVLN